MKTSLIAGALLVSLSLSVVPAFAQGVDPLIPDVGTDPTTGNADFINILDTVLRQLTDGAAPDIWDTGMALWRGMAALLVVWTGLRIAFTGDFQAWELIRLVFALWFSVG